MIPCSVRLLGGVMIALLLLATPVESTDIPFLRGDANVDGRVDIADGIWLLNHLYLGGPGGSCLAAGDANGDGVADLSDAALLIAYRLLDGGPPAYPFPYCDLSEVAGTCAQYDVCPAVPEVTVTRDDRGVWFIEGGTLYQLYEAFGHAVATDRLWQAEIFRRLGRGSLSEIYGFDQLETDLAVRLLGYSQDELQEAFDNLSEESRILSQGYVDGFNRRIGEVEADLSLLPYEFQELGFFPAPWSVNDVMGLQVTLLRNFDAEALATFQLDNAVLLEELVDSHPRDGLQMFDDLRWINDPSAPTMIPASEIPVTMLPAGNVPTPVPVAGQYKIPNLRAVRDGIARLLEGSVEALETINGRITMGSYAWVVSGDRTESGNPILYSGPQMGFMTPSIIVEGSLRGAGIEVSGMALAGLPGIIIGRTPRHAWSMQVGHAHTTDIFLDDPADAFLHHIETVVVKDGPTFDLPVYRTEHGSVLGPLPFNPETSEGPAIVWRYSQWGHELKTVEGNLGFVKARNIDEFATAIENFAVTQHICYADRLGNIAYWLTGFDPVRAPGADPRLPQLGDGTMDWPEPITLKPRNTARNPEQGFFAGWNNKASPLSDNSVNPGYNFGRFHRCHKMQDYLSDAGIVSFEEVRDLAIRVGASDCCSLGGNGGNRWKFIEEYFSSAVLSEPTSERLEALSLLENWDGQFVAGGESQWVDGPFAADAWLLQERWITRMLELVFEDELDTESMSWGNQNRNLLFNVLIRAFEGDSSPMPNHIDWFRNLGTGSKPENPQELVLLALDLALADLGDRPWNQERETIDFNHEFLGQVWSTPFLNRSTYAQVIEIDGQGPLRIESMIPLGESGAIYSGARGEPVFDEHFFSFTDIFDSFAPRPFPTFDD
ncbi:MAG TPA: penicillin acylase family protein [Planctomycetes bacterium]|nr:penicillin acylase family protein [Planctomycetota bacterium]HIN80242.1 penicillin acylase family protein [Planctomycetota bacterium]